jgi:hypothetical protein
MMRKSPDEIHATPQGMSRSGRYGPALQLLRYQGAAPTGQWQPARIVCLYGPQAQNQRERPQSAAADQRKHQELAERHPQRGPPQRTAGQWAPAALGPAGRRGSGSRRWTAPSWDARGSVLTRIMEPVKAQHWWGWAWVWVWGWGWGGAGVRRLQAPCLLQCCFCCCSFFAPSCWPHANRSALGFSSLSIIIGSWHNTCSRAALLADRKNLPVERDGSACRFCSNTSSRTRL